MIGLLTRDIAVWRRRPEVVAVSLVTLAVVAGLWVSGFLTAQAAGASLPGPSAARDAAQAAFLAPYRFPASLVWIVASGTWLFFGVYYVGAATTGGDLVWGTLRTALLAGRGRTEFVVVRLAFVVLLGVVLLAVEASLGAALPILLSTGEGPPVHATGVILGVAAGLLGVSVYGSAGVCAAILSRDRAAPLMVGAAAVAGAVDSEHAPALESKRRPSVGPPPLTLERCWVGARPERRGGRHPHAVRGSYVSASPVAGRGSHRRRLGPSLLFRRGRRAPSSGYRRLTTRSCRGRAPALGSARRGMEGQTPCRQLRSLLPTYPVNRSGVGRRARRCLVGLGPAGRSMPTRCSTVHQVESSSWARAGVPAREHGEADRGSSIRSCSCHSHQGPLAGL